MNKQFIQIETDVLVVGGGGFGGGDHGEGVAAELREERDGGGDFGNPAKLPGTIGAEVMDDEAGRDAVKVGGTDESN